MDTAQNQTITAPIISEATPKLEVRGIRNLIASHVAGELASEMRSAPDPEGWVGQWSARWLTSYHEAGHATVRIVLDMAIAELHVFEGGGLCVAVKPENAADAVKDLTSDNERAEALAAFLAEWGYSISLPRLRKAVRRLLKRHWNKVKNLAIGLHEKGTLYEPEIRRIFENS